MLEPVAGVFIVSQGMVDWLTRFTSHLVNNPGSLIPLNQRLPMGVAISLILLVVALIALWTAVR